MLRDLGAAPDFPWRGYLLKEGIATILMIPMFVSGEAAGILQPDREGR